MSRIREDKTSFIPFDHLQLSVLSFCPSLLILSGVHDELFDEAICPFSCILYGSENVSLYEKHVVFALFLHQKNFFFCPFYACFQRLKMQALFLQ